MRTGVATAWTRALKGHSHLGFSPNRPLLRLPGSPVSPHTYNHAHSYPLATCRNSLLHSGSGGGAWAVTAKDRGAASAGLPLGLPSRPSLPLFPLGSPQEDTPEAPHLSWREPRLTPLAGDLRQGTLNFDSRKLHRPHPLAVSKLLGPERQDHSGGDPPFPCLADARAVPFHWGRSSLDQRGPKSHPSVSLGKP